MKNLKRVLALVTVFAMVMSVSAFAHSYTYDAGMDSEQRGTNDSLADIISGNVGEESSPPVSYSTANITMMNDETVNSTIEITSGHDVDIDLNGFSITNSESFSGDALIEVKAGAELTIDDDSTTHTGNITNTQADTWSSAVDVRGELNVEGGKLSGYDVGIYGYSNSDIDVSGGTIEGGRIGIWNNGELDVSGGTLKDTNTGSNSFGAIYNNGVVDVTGGTLEGQRFGLNNQGGTANVSEKDGDTAISGSIYGVVNASNGSTTIEDATITSGFAGVSNSGGTVVMNSGDVSGTDRGVSVSGDNASFTMNGGSINGAGGVNLFEGADFTMTDGTISATTSFGVSNNGNDGDAKYTNQDITVSGGSITSQNAAGIYHAGPGNTTISGNAYIEGKSGIEIRNGTLTVNGGTIVGTGNPFAEQSNGNGSTTTGSGIAVAQHTTKKAITVNVNSGNVSGIYAVSVSNPENNGSENVGDVKVNINGGTYSGAFVEFDTRADTTTTINGLTTPTRSGYNFIGWTDDAGNAITFPYDVGTNALTLVAQWEAIPVVVADDFTPDYDFSDDAGTTADAAPVTIEEETTPLAALPEELAEISTAADVVDTAVELGIIEAESYVATEAAAAETVVNAVAVIAGDDFGAEEVAAIAEEVGVSFEGEVTRNDLVVVLFTLAEKQGYDVSARASLDAFTDADKASEAMAWAVEVGLINGVDVDKLDPTGTLTQEQLLIIIIARFMALTK